MQGIVFKCLTSHNNLALLQLLAPFVDRALELRGAGDLSKVMRMHATLWPQQDSGCGLPLHGTRTGHSLYSLSRWQTASVSPLLSSTHRMRSHLGLP